MVHATRTGIIIGFAAIYLIWGSTYLAIRFGVETIPPFLLAGTRFVLGGIAFMVWARLRGAPAPRVRHWFTTALIGVLLAVGGNGLVTYAEQTVPSGLAAMLVAMVPFWVTLIDGFRPNGVRPRGLTWLGLGMGFLGIILLVDPASIGRPDDLDVAGALIIILATLFWASGSVYSRYAQQPRSQILSAGMQMLTGGGVLLALSAASGELVSWDPAAVTARSGVSLVYLTVMGNVAFGAYIWLLKASTPSKVATYAYVNPVIALFLGYVLGNEPLSGWTIACSVLIVTAVVIVIRTRARRSERGRSEAVPPKPETNAGELEAA